MAEQRIIRSQPERKSGDPFSSSLQRLDDELTCPVCSDHFQEPKVLPCLHYYCKTCVADLIKRAKGVPFNCPECRRETTADGDDPDTLPTAFFVNRMEELFAVMKKAERKDSVGCESCRSQLPAVDFCHDCSKYICTDCAKAHKQMWLLSSHHVVSIDSLRSTIIENPPEKLQVVYGEVKCSKHQDEPLKLYCYSCNKLVCRDCIVIDHKDHNYAFVIDAAPLCKAEIQENSESVKKITEGVKSAVKLLGDSKKKLSDHGAETTRSIDEAIDEIIEKLAEKRREMKEKANRIVNEAEEKIATEEKNAQLAVGELESLLEFMSRTLETATDQEILSLKKQVSYQVEKVSELYIDADENFPVPELPELEVNCGARVKKVIELEIAIEEKVDASPELSEGTSSTNRSACGESAVPLVSSCTSSCTPCSPTSPYARHEPAVLTLGPTSPYARHEPAVLTLGPTSPIAWHEPAVPLVPSLQTSPYAGHVSGVPLVSSSPTSPYAGLPGHVSGVPLVSSSPTSPYARLPGHVSGVPLVSSSPTSPYAGHVSGVPLVSSSPTSPYTGLPGHVSGVPLVSSSPTSPYAGHVSGVPLVSSSPTSPYAGHVSGVPLVSSSPTSPYAGHVSGVPLVSSSPTSPYAGLPGHVSGVPLVSSSPTSPCAGHVSGVPLVSSSPISPYAHVSAVPPVSSSPTSSYARCEPAVPPVSSPQNSPHAQHVSAVPPWKLLAVPPWKLLAVPKQSPSLRSPIMNTKGQKKKIKKNY